MAKKILIVEDDLELEQLLAVLLKEAGFTVLSSSDAYGGIKLAAKERPDLIVLDISLPAGGGLTMLRNLKSSIYLKDIAVIITTGLNLDEQTKKEIKYLGIKDFIQKPYSSKELTDLIKKALFVTG